jgi:predicted RNA-binding Zn ribbon-like protein
VAVLDAAGAGWAASALRLRPPRTARQGVDAALGTVLAAAFAAMADGTWRRLKACPGERCGWAFYDRSPSASATWCSMRVCGGRAKARAYYARRSATSRPRRIDPSR